MIKRTTPSEPPQVSDKPTSHQATDMMARHEAAEGHGDQREEYSDRVSKELNERSEYVQEQEKHARDHPSPTQRNRNRP